MLGFLAVVFVFGVIVLVHEWGHMIAAKLCGVAVPDFALGMGPSLFNFRYKDTKYHICAFPIGGFVRIAGLEGDDALPRTRQELEKMARDAEELPDRIVEGHTQSGREQALAVVQHAIDALPADQRDDAGHEAAPHVSRWRTWRDINGWQKAFVLCAGPLMNFVLAFVIILAMGLIGFPQNAVLIGSVEVGSPAEEAGIKVGDLVTGINTQRVTNSRQFSAIVHANNGNDIPLEVQRDGREITITATPRVISGYNEGRVSLGVGLNDTAYTTNVISLIQPKSIADSKLKTTAGESIRLHVGDKVTAVNSKPVTNGMDALLALTPFDFDSGKPLEGEGRQVNLTILKRDGGSHTVQLPADTTMLSLGIQFKPELEQLPLGQSLRRSLQDAQAYMVGMIWGFRILFTEEGSKSISGPVGIMNMISQSTRSGLYTFLFIFMLINLNLGLINLMPFPALDGGRLVFVALAGLGVRLSEKREALVHAVGMVMLLALIGIITFTDILPRIPF